MVSRSNFDLNLKELKDKLFAMADLEASQSLQESVEALKTQDIEKAKEIIAHDHIINRMDNEINHLAIILIAKESPVATDLRKIISALRISSEIERIGDMATNIAKSTLHIGESKIDQTDRRNSEDAWHRRRNAGRSADSFSGRRCFIGQKSGGS